MDCQICKTFCTKAFCVLNQRIDLLSRHSALSFCVDTADRAAIFQCTLKHNKVTVSDNFAYIMQFYTETHIRFVGTKTIHSLLPCNSLNWKLDIHIQNFFEQISQQSFIYINNIIYIYEGQLHIDLSELRLTVCAQILITVASCQLEITIITRAHQ